MLTTTSALGRSSIYNRLKFGDRFLFNSVGYTHGSGDFQFLNGAYEALSGFANDYCDPTAKKDAWGTGFRNRREVVRKCLADLGLASDWMYHGVKREVFVIPLARNMREFLRGEHSKLLWHGQPASDLFHFFRQRWLLPRAARANDYKQFDPQTYRLWGEGNCREVVDGRIR